MNPNIFRVGLDVDDTQYHGSAFNRETGEVIDFRCRPTLKGLLTQLDKLQRHFRGCSIRNKGAGYIYQVCSAIRIWNKCIRPLYWNYQIETPPNLWLLVGAKQNQYGAVVEMRS